MSIYRTAFDESQDKLKISSLGGAVSKTTTRPANTTAYSVGDVVGEDPAANLVFNNVSSVSGATVIITGASLQARVGTTPSGYGNFRLHLYNQAPTAIVDNAAFNLPSGDRSKYLGYIEFETPEDLGDTLWSRVNNINMQAELSTTSLFGILETRSAFTPSSGAEKELTLHVLEV